MGIDHPANGTEYALGCGLCRHGANEPIKPNNKPQPFGRPNMMIPPVRPVNPLPNFMVRNNAPR